MKVESSCITFEEEHDLSTAFPTSNPSPPLPFSQSFLLTRFFSTCSSFIQWHRLLRVTLSSFLQRRISLKKASKDGWGQTSWKCHPNTDPITEPVTLTQTTSPQCQPHHPKRHLSPLPNRNSRRIFSAEVSITSCNSQGISVSQNITKICIRPEGKKPKIEHFPGI